MFFSATNLIAFLTKTSFFTFSWYLCLPGHIGRIDTSLLKDPQPGDKISERSFLRATAKPKISRKEFSYMYFRSSALDSNMLGLDFVPIDAPCFLHCMCNEHLHNCSPSFCNRACQQMLDWGRCQKQFLQNFNTSNVE